MIRHLKITGAVVVALLTLPALARAEPSLRPQTSIDRESVLLSDLFADLPATVRGNAEVAPAPAPGQKLNFDASRLLSLAANYGVAWKPISRFDKAVVERAGRTVSMDNVRAALTSALIAAGQPAETEIQLENEQLRLTVPASAEAAVGVQDLRVDNARNRFSAMLVAPADAPIGDPVKIQGRLYRSVEVAVPTRPIQSGEVIRARDLEVIRLRTDQVGPAVVTDPDRMIGKAPHRMLQARQTVRASDLAFPTWVTKNAMAKVKVISDRLNLVMEAKVLDDGVKGDSVRVLNVRSNKTIQGIVTAPGEVTVPSNYAVVLN